MPNTSILFMYTDVCKKTACVEHNTVTTSKHHSSHCIPFIIGLAVACRYCTLQNTMSDLRISQTVQYKNGVHYTDMRQNTQPHLCIA